jgi:ferredoxin
MRIRIDHDRCEGHGRCWDIAPDLVDDDDRGHGVVRDPDAVVPPELEAQARDAARSCPEHAVTLSH